LTIILSSFLENNKDKKTEKYNEKDLEDTMLKINKSISDKKDEIEENDLVYFGRNIVKYIKSKKKKNFKVDEYLAFMSLVNSAFTIIELKKIDAVNFNLKKSEEEIKKIESETLKTPTEKISVNIVQSNMEKKPTERIPGTITSLNGKENKKQVEKPAKIEKEKEKKIKNDKKKKKKKKKKRKKNKK